MPRKHREEVAGGVFHVYARGNKKADIYVDDVDREGYVELLGLAVVRHGWECLAYCLMPNHVHLLVRTPRPNLALGMQMLHGRYAQAFNRRHDLSGHVFQGRYGAVRVTDDAQLWTTVGYVATNPVAAGLVRDAAAWEWGSHRAVVTGAVPGWLALSALYALLAGANRGTGRERYDELVAARGLTTSASDVMIGAGSASVER